VSSRPTENTDGLLVHGARVKTLISRLISTNTSSLEIVHIGDIADLVDLPSNVSRRFDVSTLTIELRAAGSASLTAAFRRSIRRSGRKP